ncbi:hypothetical protein [Burkholderia sp. Bp9090]|uniref:hypothetical protein n=1 Tax=Burkholderia sp. Bp9090 TaxID=2184567 RepID=UPI00163A58DD
MLTRDCGTHDASARPHRADLPKLTTTRSRYRMPRHSALSVVQVVGQVMRVAVHPAFPLDQRTTLLRRRHQQKLVHRHQEFPTRFLRQCGKIEQQWEYLPYMAHGVPLQY